MIILFSMEFALLFRFLVTLDLGVTAHEPCFLCRLCFDLAEIFKEYCHESGDIEY